MLSKLKQRIFLLSLLFPTAGLLAQPAQTYQTASGEKCPLVFADSHRALVEKFFQEHADETVQAKVVEFSTLMMGRPSGWQQAKNASVEKSAESLKVDSEHFDCVTFVEQVLAAARSHNVEEFLRNLSRIRYYAGKVRFELRLHFPEADWIPENSRNGVIQDVTLKITDLFDPSAYKSKHIVIDKLNWFKTFFPLYVEDFEREFPDQHQVDVALGYIDFDNMWTHPEASENDPGVFAEKQRLAFEKMLEAKGDEQKKLQKELETLRYEHRMKGATLRNEFVAAMPAVSVFALIRPNYAVLDKDKQKVTDMLVTHMGLIVKRDGQLFLRHAPSRSGAAVSEVPFEQYFSNFMVTGSNLDDANNQRSSWRGLNIQKIREIDTPR